MPKIKKGNGSRSPLEPALDFLQRLWALNHTLERMSLQMERHLGVTAQQRLIVRCIGKYPGITASELSGVLHLDRGTVSVSLRRMAKKGLISRRRERDDTRRVSLALTARGRGLDRPNERSVEAAVRALLRKSGGRKVAAAKGLLDQLSQELTRRLD